MHSCTECGTALYRAPKAAAARKAKTCNCPADVWTMVKRHRNADTERLIVIALDTSNAVIGRPEIVSIGALNTTRTLPREIFRKAVIANALSIIIVHNHPSGSLDPSQDDISFTRATKRGADHLGIALLDHVLISKRGYISFKERGLL